MKNRGLVAVVAAAALGAATVGAAERPDRGARKAGAQVVPTVPEVTKTITYDTGVNVGFHPDSGVAALNRVVGNRFNSINGGPIVGTAMITRLTVFPANTGPQSVSIANPPNTMNTAMVLDFVTAPLQASVFNSVQFIPAVTVGPDFLGLFLGTFGTNHGAGLLGMSDMSTMGQGYHAVQAFYSAGMATMIEVVPARNAMLRATGDIVWPVELMDFRVE